MANRDAPTGLRPVRHQSGGLTRFAGNPYAIGSGYATAIYTGDPVKLSGVNNEIARVASGDTVIGVFMGCEYTNAAGERVWGKYWPASTTATDIIAYVIDDPDVIYEVQATGSLTMDAVGNLYDLSMTAGSAITGVSKAELDSSASTNDDLYVVALVNRADNEAGSANVKLEVMFNKHAFHNAGAARFAEVA